MYSATAQYRPLILLIEGLQDRYEALAEAFEAECCEVAHARSVADALIQARGRRPDMVVLDPAPAASVTRELNRLRSDPSTCDLPLIVIRCQTTSADPMSKRASTLRPVDLHLLLEHLRRVVIHVLAHDGDRPRAGRWEARWSAPTAGG